MCLHISPNVCLVIILTLASHRTSNQKGGLSEQSSRQLWYDRSLNLWNQDSTIRDHIVVIENSNQQYDIPHLELINFNHSVHYENKHCSRPTRAIGEHELISIHEGMSRAKRMAGATHVIKITGRYYIPGFAHVMQNLSETHEIVHMHGYVGGCQIMGCRRDVCSSLWKCPYERYSHCEATVKHRMQTHEKAHCYELPLLHTAYTFRGSDSKEATTLSG